MVLFMASESRLPSSRSSIWHSRGCRSRGGPACCNSWSRCWLCSPWARDTAGWEHLCSLNSPISRGRFRHLKPLPWMVVASSLYLSVFLVSAAAMLADVSQGTVNSTSFTSLDFRLMMTRSGFWAVIATSEGMVTPLTLCPSRSA